MNIDNQSEIVDSFSALGHKSRLSLFLLLMGKAQTGLKFGELQTASGIPASTLSHHLGELERGKLIERTREGRETHFRPQMRHLSRILNIMMEACCKSE